MGRSFKRFNSKQNKDKYHITKLQSRQTGQAGLRFNSLLHGHPHWGAWRKMNIIYVFGILLLIIAITETVLSGTWNKYYFLHGIPIFSKEIEISNINKASKEIQNFIITLDTFSGFSKYKGTMFDENTFAFRKKMITVSFYRNDLENIHGTISINPERSSP